jgi:hypothetical protein
MPMTAGEYVPNKFIWLLDNVELIGTVHKITKPPSGGTGDDFSLIPDANYEHLIRYFRGNSPLPWDPIGDPAVMELETIPPDRGEINRWEGWSLNSKPGGEQFTVRLRNGTSRALEAGDRVRVTGRWVIDHHPEMCDWPATRFSPPEPSRCRNMGPLRVGRTHTELHPFDWQNIWLVEPPRTRDASTCVVSMAAPLYEEQYLGGWKWAANEFRGVSGRVFIDERVTPQGTITNFNTMVGTRIHLPAPPLTDIPASSYHKMTWGESVLKLGRGMNIDDVRTVTTTDRSIDVQVTVIARTDDGSRPTILGPAQGRWIAQIRYSVGWVLAGNEISCITRGVGTGGIRPVPGPLIGVGGRFPNGDSWWLRVGDAVEAIRTGHNFYVEPLFGSRVDVVVVGTGSRATLGTDPRPLPGGRPDPLLQLPLCPDPPIPM